MKDKFRNMYQREYWRNCKRKEAEQMKADEAKGLFADFSHCPITGLPLKDHKDEYTNLKKYATAFARLIMCLLVSISANSQMHLDAYVGGNTRLHSVVSVGVTYQAPKGFETSLIGTFENKHHTSIGATVGLRAWVNDLPSDGVIPFVGLSYQFYTESAKTELKNGFMPVVGLRMQDNWGSFELRYSGNSFNLLFGYRFLNHK